MTRHLSKRAIRRAIGRARLSWRRDEDGWLCRPARDGDPDARLLSLTSWHAFNEDGLLYCRNWHQAAVLDLGEMV